MAGEYCDWPVEGKMSHIVDSVYIYSVGNHMYMYPGATVRVITREARYYAKTRAFASFYAIISRAHAARAVT